MFDLDLATSDTPTTPAAIPVQAAPEATQAHDVDCGTADQTALPDDAQEALWAAGRDDYYQCLYAADDADQPFPDVTIESLDALEKEDSGNAPDCFQTEEYLNVHTASEADTQEIDWLWNGWLARGELHLLAGEPGVCKTTLALTYAAIVSNGGTWPDGTKCDKPQRVLLWSNEDSFPRFIVPRLEAASAKNDYIGLIVDAKPKPGIVEPFEPSRHIHLLEKAIKPESNIGLLIVDSIADVVAGDGNNNVDVRRSLKALCRVAQKCNIAVLGIVHLNKGNSRNPIHRVIGSIGFVGMARLVQVVVEDTNDPDNRRLARVKSNLGDTEGGFLLGIETELVGKEKTIEAPRIVWKGDIPGNGKDIISQTHGLHGDDSPRQEKEIDKAKRIILEMVRAAGKAGIAAADIYARCKELRITESTLKRAKAELHIPHVRAADGTRWFAPPQQSTIGMA
jgi:putative DNA primase/helicase